MVGVSRVFGTGLLFLSATCASQQYADVGVLAAEFRADEVAAAAKYQDEILGLGGRVMDKGLKSGKAAETQAAPMWGGVWSSKTVMVNKTYGYLVLQSEPNSGPMAVCLFESTKLKELAPVQKGQAVSLRCLFSMVVGDRSARVPVFYGCTVDS
jgi:hypothetical protein